MLVKRSADVRQLPDVFRAHPCTSLPILKQLARAIYERSMSAYRCLTNASRMLGDGSVRRTFSEHLTDVRRAIYTLMLVERIYT